MNQVCVLIEACEGEEATLNVYGNIGDAANQASERASLLGWNKVDGQLIWMEPDTWYNYVEVQVQQVL